MSLEHINNKPRKSRFGCLDDVVNYLLSNGIRKGECLLYHKVPENNGYGRVKYKGSLRLVHRLVASKKLNLKYSDKTWDACHKCDVRNCIEPTHIFKGDDSINQRDKILKHPELRYWGKNARKVVVSI